MGKLNQGPFQGFIGKTGGLVGKRWKGKYVVSAYQPNVNNPKSSGQQLQRDFFKQAVSLVLGFFTGIIRATLSTGWTGITLTSSNIGSALKAIRYHYYGINSIDTKEELSLTPGSLCTGLADMGNTIFNGLTIKQQGTTGIGNLSIDPEPGVKYFGSEIPLNGLRMVYMSQEDEIVFNDVNCELLPQVVDTTIEKTYGLQGAVDQVGNWPYVYKINTTNLGAEASCNTVATPVKGVNVNQAWFNVGFYVPNSYVFTSRFITKNLTVAP